MLRHVLAQAAFMGFLASHPALCCASNDAKRMACTPPTTIGNQRVLVFPDGSIAMRTKLAVNPDGAFASYTVGDHGFTYVADGIDLWKSGRRHDCREPGLDCRTKFLSAAEKDFAAGTTEFCAFGFEVEASGGRDPTTCPGGTVFGNGQGKPREAQPLSTVTGAMITPYASTTAIKHTVGGVPTYIDSAAIPSLVSPRVADLGRVAWVRMRSANSTYA